MASDSKQNQIEDNSAHKYDAFLSHRQANGGDLAEALKLQLEAKDPSLRIFLDVDDLENVHSLDDKVKGSRNFILIITEGALERPFIQLEIRAAIKYKSNVILVHDEKSCPFPNGQGLPEDVRSILAYKAIPYFREKAFREVSVQSIFNKMIAGPQLKVQGWNTFEVIWEDKGSGAAKDMSLYKPVKLPDKWVILGDHAESHYGNAFQSTLVAFDDGSSKLKSPVDLEQSWSDKGSGAKMDCSVWRMIPPANYVSLGFVVQAGYSKPDISNYRCVHKDYVVESSVQSNSVWDYQKTGAQSIWDVKGDNSLDCGCFFMHSSLKQPEKCPTLKASNIRKQN